LERANDRFGFRRGLAIPLADDRRQFADGGSLEQGTHREVALECLPQSRNELDCQKRVAAQVEEVVVDADLRYAENRLPDLRDPRLDLVRRRDVGDPDIRAVAEAE